ncbi:hypothetical protein AKJ64_00690 [candidate division MSBL1 archaeon SCGC-AAA259E17]|uniref:Uncharacterized protein n=1 Tax=candidate division MSBL1 archaeon SCGC-AAA259E17 TaxID=1698263 RepID=A0A133UGN7_9EURY|nr:hypothetical protein AKJ64_00690 [candidate division MSBL1 archaeon SCGC-AAA259E17]
MESALSLDLRILSIPNVKERKRNVFLKKVVGLLGPATRVLPRRVDLTNQIPGFEPFLARFPTYLFYTKKEFMNYTLY